ncbi:MAG: hypothetical protein HUJ77_05685 [Clostridium sp.]|uniref:hypothetical protein n=1 Tax=Clostridium sp. TaxID=1506 RepID=UPI0025C13119|nr:hypothetical protein [Clostridium sp.]MCF0147873.1 hypothetical protein [Clostridium sp.]
MRNEILKIDLNAYIDNLSYIVSFNRNKIDISFRNISDEIIKGIKFTAKAFDSFNEIVEVNSKEDFILTIQDLSIPPRKIEQLSLELPNSSIRKIELKVLQVCFANGDIHTNPGENIKEYTVEFYDLEDIEEKEIVTVLKKFNPSAKNKSYLCDDGWVCNCSYFNKLNNKVCVSCGVNYNTSLFFMDNENINKEINIYREDLKKQKELKIQKDLERKRKLKLISKIAVPVLIIYVILSIVLNITNKVYDSEDSMKTYFINNKYSSNIYYSVNIKIKDDYIEAYDSLDKVNFFSSYQTIGIKEWNYKEGFILLQNGMKLYLSGSTLILNYKNNEYSFTYESSSFRLSVQKDYSITDCSVTILDYM